MKEHPTILVAEDENPIRMMLAELLTMEGYQVLTATDGEEALEGIVQNAVDIALLDVNMPKLDGFSVTRQLRSQEKTRLLPIILVTGLNATEDRIQGIEAGCDDFISKPFNSGELLARIQSLLQINYYRSLLDEKEKFEYVIENIGYGVVVLDPNLSVTRINQKARDLLGWKETDPPGSVWQKIRTEFQFHSAVPVGDVDKVSLHFDIERPEKEDVRPLIISVQSSAVRDPSGAVRSILLLLTDVTEVRKSEYQKESFLNLISHKLRTPLTVIQGNLSMLQDGVVGALSDKQSHLISTMLAKCSEFQLMIDKLLGFTTLTNARLQLKREPLVLREYFLKRAERGKNRQTPGSFQWEIKCTPPDLVVPVDLYYWDLLIENILENSLEHGGATHVKIRVLAKRVGDSVEIVIADNGKGIPPEDVGRIFEKFYQVNKWDTGNLKGLGLGMAVVKQLVAAHGGEVRIESPPGSGTSCILTIPSRPGK